MKRSCVVVQSSVGRGTAVGGAIFAAVRRLGRQRRTSTRDHYSILHWRRDSRMTGVHSETGAERGSSTSGQLVQRRAHTATRSPPLNALRTATDAAGEGGADKGGESGEVRALSRELAQLTREGLVALSSFA
ncbi:hypothetical protein MTO96_044929 [Rhipicephalus appendiculatus]